MVDDDGRGPGRPRRRREVGPRDPDPDPGPVDGSTSWLRESAGLVRLAGRVLARHWLPLLAIAAASLLARELLARLAVAAGGVGPVPGFLVLALVPLASLAALVAMLLVVRSRDARRSHVWGVVAAAGSVLVPFLVVYESRGALRADLIDYVRGTLYEQLGSEAPVTVLPQIASWLVLGIVAAALVVRALGARLIDRGHLQGRSDARAGLVHVVTGYAEAVWVTLGAWVLAGFLGSLHGWWSAREVAASVAQRWDSVREQLPTLGAFGDWVVGALPVLSDAVVTGVLVPISMLTIAVIVYGLQVADTVTPDDVVRAVRRGRWAALTGRIADAPLKLAWVRLSDTSGRFGALAGGISLVLRSSFAPVLTYCVLFTLLAQLDVVVWWVARLALGWREELTWQALHAPLDGIAEMLTLVLTAVVTAAFADRLLTRFGAAGQLRDRGARSPAAAR